MLTMLAMLACGQMTLPQRPADFSPRGCRDRSCWTRVSGRGGGSSSAGGESPANFAPQVSFEWPWYGERLPDPVTDTSFVAASGVGRIDGGTAWQWRAQDGGSIAFTAYDAGITATVVSTFIPGVRALEITAVSKAPSIVSTELNALYGQVPDTSICVGYGRAAGRANGTNWWTGAYPGGANGFFDMVYDSTGATEGSAGYWTLLNAPAVGATAIAVNDGWGIVGNRYDGSNSCANNTHGTLDTNDFNTQSCAGLRRDFLVGTYFMEGADRTAGSNFLNGPLVTCARGGTRLDDWAYLAWVDKIWGSYSADQHIVLKQSATVQGEAIDNSAWSGNVDVMWTKAPMVTPLGLRTYKHHTNNWCSDPLDFTTCTAIGGTQINTNVLAGPFSAMKGGTAECDEIVDNDAGSFMGVIGNEQISSPVPVPDDGGSRDTHYINADFFLRAGRDDGGAGNTYDQATIIWVSNGTQSLNSCAVTGLPNDGGFVRVNCAPKFENPTDGGALSSAKPRLVVGTDAGQVGSIVACFGNTNTGPYMSSPWATTVARPDTYYDVPPSAGLRDAGSWPSIADGGAIDLVYVPLFQGSAISVQPELGDPEYLLDVFNTGTQDHTVVIVAGYPPSDGGSPDCSLLVGFRDGSGHNTDFEIANQCETVGHAYAIRAEARGLGTGRCKDYVFRNDCGVPPVLTANDTASVAAWRAALHAFTSGCSASTLIASDTTGNAFCPGASVAPDHAFLCNRLTANVPGDCQFLKLQVSR